MLARRTRDTNDLHNTNGAGLRIFDPLHGIVKHERICFGRASRLAHVASLSPGRQCLRTSSAYFSRSL